MQEAHHNWHFGYKKKLIALAVLLCVCIGITLYLQDCSCHAYWYNDNVFQPFQLLRNHFFGFIPFSLGDLLYISWGVSLIVLIVRWAYYLLHYQRDGDKLLYSFIKGATSLAGLYLFFMLGWGGNYYKESLSDYWQQDHGSWNKDQLVAFDRFLVKQLNETAPHYHDNTFKNIEDKAQYYYKRFTDCPNNANGLHVKPTLFGNMLQYMGVQGYYNPFTGEGQVNRNELAFMLPYVTCHEMAHQSGVGAEDDANLLAYVLSVQTNDSSFMYSAYFNLWLYTHIQLKMRDTVAANAIKKDLNPISLNHLEELRKERRKYRSKFSNYTGGVYDQYLKLNNQKDGIESYDKVTVSAWIWERNRTYDGSLIRIP